MPGYPLVSVVVVNWNGQQVIPGCLASLAGQIFPDFEVIVVDNGSTDGSIALLESSSLPIRLILNIENKGFCGANNQGIEAAQGKYVALLNNDAEAEPGWLAALVAAIGETAGAPCGMVASKILLFDDRRRIDKVGHLIYPDGQNRGRGLGEIDAGQYEELEETLWPDGCAALYSADMLRQIGGFDEDFFAYADDAELGLRGRIAGWRALYAPKAVVYHRGGSTLGRYSPRRLFLIERNRIWLVAKLFPLRLWPLTPYYFVRRVIATAFAHTSGQGEAFAATRQMGAWALIQCITKANAAALLGLPRMIRKRSQINEFRKLNGAEIHSLLEHYRIPLDDLARKSV
ncbi:MAG: glycosyltransferase family 2 protein [Acidobacteria bacterium]|nr:glycosyltransferase family 2 protein [Acidobacteriota bacterium]